MLHVFSYLQCHKVVHKDLVGSPATDASLKLVRTDEVVIETAPQIPLTPKTAEFVLASDSTAIVEHTRNILILEDDDMVG